MICDGGGAATVATHELAGVLVPPKRPEQLHFQGPLPEMADGDPGAQRFVVGALVKEDPLADPHVPLTAERVLFALMKESSIP